jgi:septal ring factor EnvC (AmiA/AmiB activator)
MMLRISIAVSSLISLAFLWIFCLAEVDSEGRNQLETIRDELQSKRLEYEKLGQKEKDELARLGDIEEQIALSGQLILKIERTSGKLLRTIQIEQVELKMAQVALEEKKKALQKRLRYIYKVGNRPGWMEIISSRDPTEALRAFKNMRAIVAYDNHLVESLKDLSQGISETLKKLRSDKKLLEDLGRDNETELELRKVTFDRRKKLVDKLRRDKSAIARSMESLEEDAGHIAGIFDDLQADNQLDVASLELPGLEGNKADLIWPVQGLIIRPFGSRRDERGVTITNPGIDIKASYGTGVRAADRGKVIYVSWLRGYGQFVIVDHGQSYYTLYANLSSISVEIGDDVTAGQVIAEVGDSGTLEGPRLHFELRHKKEQLNPVDWLR